jgi:hypothetical protein
MSGCRRGTVESKQAYAPSPPRIKKLNKKI